ncbi:TUBGCP4 [Branchiostoma lanceolatum]|uniref:Gamma-tubulin complex component n=1 Tax=Branchiostoma lanceolatum TaxID=7740 RepID=A0A8J9ZHT7_BRALA|nr:TUBGCP4 [Branchiostoma lanceolatum]
MLHEVLLALSGYPGNIFVEKDGSLEVVPDLPFIHPSEQEILSSLCKLGTFYMKFKAFTTKYGGAPIHPGKEEAHTSDLHGLYLIAFCSGLERVLEPYRQALLTLEREILEDPQLTVFYVQTELMQYKLLFPAISSVIRQVESQRAHGCYILEILHKNSFCGMPEVRNAMEIILYYCHGVLYKQLSAWLIHGLLLDRYNEFFIHQGKVLADAARAGSQGDDDDLGIGGLSGKQLRELMDSGASSDHTPTSVTDKPDEPCLETVPDQSAGEMDQETCTSLPTSVDDNTEFSRDDTHATGIVSPASTYCTPQTVAYPKPPSCIESTDLGNADADAAFPEDRTSTSLSSRQSTFSMDGQSYMYSSGSVSGTSSVEPELINLHLNSEDPTPTPTPTKTFQMSTNSTLSRSEVLSPSFDDKDGTEGSLSFMSRSEDHGSSETSTDSRTTVRQSHSPKYDAETQDEEETVSIPDMPSFEECEQRDQLHTDFLQLALKLIQEQHQERRQFRKALLARMVEMRTCLQKKISSQHVIATVPATVDVVWQVSSEKVQVPISQCTTVEEVITFMASYFAISVEEHVFLMDNDRAYLNPLMTMAALYNPNNSSKESAYSTQFTLVTPRLQKLMVQKSKENLLEMERRARVKLERWLKFINYHCDSSAVSFHDIPWPSWLEEDFITDSGADVVENISSRILGVRKMDSLKEKQAKYKELQTQWDPQVAGEEEETKAYVQFALRPEMLPSYIPVRLAEKILFVGESIQMFEHDKDRPAMKRTGSILKNSEDQFAEELHQLSKAPLFNLAAFESVIDRIRKSVAEHLWKLVVEEADLFGHLKLMKDFYLLGRGELYLAFIDCAQSILRGPPTSVTEHDVNAAFLQAARDVLLDDDEVTQFRLSVQTKGQKGQKKPSGPLPSGEIGWGVLGLSYSVQWPLHILFTEAVLDKYNTMFRFLLSVKRVQLELQHCWALQMEGKHMVSEQSEVAKWQLRTHMAFLLDNLQYYLQVNRC